MATGRRPKGHRPRARELAAGGGAGRADDHVVRNLAMGLHLGSSLPMRRGNLGPSWPWLEGTGCVADQTCKSEIVTSRSDVKICIEGGLGDRGFG